MPITFKDLYTIALERVDEDTTNPDTIILDVIKNGINEGYMLVAALLDKTTTTVTKDFDKVIPLPLDFEHIEEIEHDNLGYFGKNEYKIVGTNLYPITMGVSSGTITITYVKYPTKLSADTDVIALKDSHASIPAIYGAYAYMLHRKKYSAAQLLLQEFNSYLQGQ